MAGVIKTGPNKDRFKKAGPAGAKSRFKGCVQTQVNKGKTTEQAKKLCGFIAAKKKGG
jgi:hypothetical protein